MVSAGAEEIFDEYELRRLLTTQGEVLENIIERSHFSAHKGFYRFIIQFLTHLSLTDEEAKLHFHNLLEHRRALTEKLHRDVGMRVAAMDYFFNVVKVLNNPRIVEIPMFDEMEQKSKEDSKTGCFNMAFFTELLDKEIKRAQRYDQNASLMIIDIDNFKAFNDLYGHMYGDGILKEFCGILKESVRSEDVVARFGGDEFLVLMPQTGRVGARFLAERIKSALEQYSLKKKETEGIEEIRFSAGIATLPFDGIDYKGLIQSADTSLYKSKALGKNRIYDNLEEKPGEGAVVSERRRAPRYVMANNTEIDMVRNSEVLNIRGKVINISQSGVLLECNCKLSEKIMEDGFNLQVRKVGDSAVPSMSMKAHVAHLYVENENIKFRLGLKFKKELAHDKWQEIRENAMLSIS
jgi:diguanylate cyclase (GGDEF)-like protein